MNSIQTGNGKEEVFYHAFLNSHDMISITRLSDGIFREVNHSFAKAAGYSREEMIGRTSIELGLWSDVNERSTLLADVFEQKTIVDLEIQLRLRSGEVSTGLLNAQPLDWNGEACIFSVIRDITKQKKAEEELQRVHNIYRKAIESSRGVPYLLNFKTGQYDFIGEGCRELLGMETEEIDLLQLEELIKELIVKGPEAPPDPVAAGQAFRSGRLKRYEADYHIVTDKGDEKWLNDCSVPLQDPKTGEVIGSLGILYEITPRIKAEQAARENENKYRLLVENTGLVIASINREGYFTFANSKAADYFRCNVGDIIGKTIWEIFPPEYADLKMALIRPVIDTGKGYTEICPAMVKEGVRWFAGNVQPLVGPNGRITEALIIAEDITERKKAEDALKLTQFSVDHAGDSIFWVTPEGSIFYVNEAACRLLDYTSQELCALTISDLDPNFPLESFRSNWQVVREHSPVILETLIRRRDGAQIPIEVTQTHVASGAKEFIFGSVRDIRERKHAEEEKKRLDEELCRRERLAMIGETVSHVAHSMKNIFTALNGGVCLLEQSIKINDKILTAKTYDILKRSSLRLYLLLMNMLDYSKKREPIWEEIKTAAIFNEVAKMLEIAAERYHISIESTINPNAEVILMDSQRLFRALLNLGNNAIEAMPRGGVLRFTASRKESHEVHNPGTDHVVLPPPNPVAPPRTSIIIEVSDNGCGIPQPIREEIFEPFFSTKGSRGTGLGLTSTRQFVLDHNGQIEIDSAPEKGAVIRMIFPVRSTFGFQSPSLLP